MIKIALTIAGSDSCGGAGVQADLKTFTAFGVFGASAITALTAQNTLGVRSVVDVEPAFVVSQIDAGMDDLPVAAAKTGMLAHAGIIEALAEHLGEREIANLVVDPVMVAASGDPLLAPGAVTAIRKQLFPLAALVTPNLRETEILLSRNEINDVMAMRSAVRELLDLGAHAALITGGALGGSEAVDVLFAGGQIHEFRGQRFEQRAHGAGCTLSAAIAALLTKDYAPIDAVRLAKAFISREIEHSPPLGHGSRLLNHFATMKEIN
jgi:hydroxymethylpyrimidine/phosphomethylpyrimidine kinase